MQAARWVWGCSLFGHQQPPSPNGNDKMDAYMSALSSGFKIDCLVKVDVRALIARGLERGPGERAEPVDRRSAHEIRETQMLAGEEAEEAIKLFRLPRGWFAQEVTFVPRQGAVDEDDGFLLTYVFDESQLGTVGLEEAKSELWVVDAMTMSEKVVARIKLPQRVPYGLHGEWFGRERVDDQMVRSPQF